MRTNSSLKFLSLSLMVIWFTMFALLPFCLLVGASFLKRGELGFFEPIATLQSYRDLLNTLYLRVFERSFLIAAITTCICLVMAYPLAYYLAHWQGRWKKTLILLVIIPFWTSSLIRTYALVAMLKAKGLLNILLMWLGIINQPLSLLFTNTAVLVGLVYNLLPFMILPIMTNIERLDPKLMDAARDLGAGRITIFRKIIIPLTMPGILAGAILVFLPAMTLFYISDILGGAKSLLLGNLIQNQFLLAQNWPFGASMSVVLTVVLLLLMVIYRHVALSKDKMGLL